MPLEDLSFEAAVDLATNAVVSALGDDASARSRSDTDFTDLPPGVEDALARAYLRLGKADVPIKPRGGVDVVRLSGKVLELVV